MTPSLQKYSCELCARRKVKCDRLEPCSHCSRSQSECIYRPPAPSRRHRKRPADEELLSKFTEYEGLLRRHNIDFQPLEKSSEPSPPEEKVIPTHQTSHPLHAPNENDQSTHAHIPDRRSLSALTNVQSEAANRWYGLPKELRDAPVEQLIRPREDMEVELTGEKNGSRVATSLLIPVFPSGSPQPLEWHPEPKHIFKLWQIFTENVNPLTKVIHSPTLQQRILEVSWNLETVPRPLEAIMFNVYALAVASSKPQECVQLFGETRSALLHRYRSRATQALMAAEVHTTRDLEVLQALVLFLLLEPRSELSVTIAAMATRIGHKMGMHRTAASQHMPFFEQEMRLRVWWQIMGLESFARRKSLGLTISTTDFGDVRMPMNLNDADLHPHMTNRPVAHAGVTEMIYPMMKYEVAHYVHRCLPTDSNKNPYEVVASTNPEGMERKKKALAELEKIYNEKFLRFCDRSIPLHHISVTVAYLTIHRMRFLSYHPRHQPDGGRYMSQADEDIVFDSSIQLLQLDYDLLETKFAAHLLEHHQLGQTKLDALIYMISELRFRVSGVLVDAAWALVGRMYKDYPQLLGDDRFYTYLADLTLQAWEARERQAGGQDGVPDFISVLQGIRKNADTVAAPAPTMEAIILNGGYQFGPIDDDDPLYWVNWHDFPQL